VGLGEGETSLDDLVAEHFIPRFVKMDIEGGEAKALRGAERLLSRHRPDLLIEVHGRQIEDECVDTLRSHNYHLSTVDPRRWIPDYRPLEHNRWLIAES
jgi:hypothetical protein